MATQKSGGNRKRPNKRPGYYSHYYMTRYPVNKLRRILRVNGHGAARAWAQSRGYDGILTKLLAQGVKVKQ